MADRSYPLTEEACLGARHVSIRGIVQGVGFRPFVYRLAMRYGIQGWVRNTSWGVEIEMEGTPASLDAMIDALQAEAPPLARIESLHVREPEGGDYQGFEIYHSAPQAGAYQLVSPDQATCDDCLREVLDPADRRYRYPFTNCTNCGPRFTIIERIPYDRPYTTMRAFTMCPTCQAEYDNPFDRRFHAQPNACPVCGPSLTLVGAQGTHLATGNEAMRRTAELLRIGRIVAIKGLGGYQLACDATNPKAVAQLRTRKRRPHKPFAIMVADLEAASRYARLNAEERDLLRSSSAPIVLVRRVGDTNLAPAVAPGNRTIGIMLPYTPLHHILLRDVGLPLVMTSGNLSEEPIARDNDEALRRLGHIADALLMHNRDIYSRYDDSVWMVVAGEAQPIRRARGYAPSPIRLSINQDTRPILACGGELKNTFCLTRDRYAFISQHIGDMGNLETFENYAQTLALYQGLFDISPEIVVHDMHPDYETTRRAAEMEGTRIAVQHHHAHMASCLADNAHQGPAIGVIMDGTGYGLDDRIWGGEFLVGDAAGFQRAAHLQYLPLPGGDRAIYKPYRLALAYCRALLPGRPLPPSLEEISAGEITTIERMVDRGINSPLTSSAGRLFDCVSALLGVCHEASYEAQAAIELETLAASTPEDDVASYAWGMSREDDVLGWGRRRDWVEHTRVIELTPTLAELLDDTTQATIATCARRFHATMAHLIVDTCITLRETTGLNVAALSGGCFQNGLLLSMVVPALRAHGFEVFMHHQVPCNDGGLSLGQALIAHHTIERNESSCV